MSLICLAVIAALGIWFTYGNTGLGTAATLATMIAAGVGVESFLNTFWKKQRREAEGTSEIRFWQPRRIKVHGKSLPPSAERRAASPPSYVEGSELVPPLSRRRRGLIAEEC